MSIISIAQIVISCLLIVGVLLQQRGSGLGMAFGGDNSMYATKRGAEKVIVIITIILAVAFLGTSIASLILAKS
jgi:protein translocase SecG subunit